jgi:hypothetical protein
MQELTSYSLADEQAEEQPGADENQADSQPETHPTEQPEIVKSQETSEEGITLKEDAGAIEEASSPVEEAVPAEEKETIVAEIGVAEEEAPPPVEEAAPPAEERLITVEAAVEAPPPPIEAVPVEEKETIVAEIGVAEEEAPPPPVEEAAPPAEEGPIIVEAAAVEAAAAISAAEETLPEGPSFGERLQETFASLRERLGVALGPLGERLSATFAPLRERMGDKAWIYGVVALAVVIFILALFIPPFSLLERLGITGYTTLAAEAGKNFVEHPDGIRVILPGTYEGKLRVRLESVPRADFLGFAHSSYRDAVDALPEAHLEVKSPLYKIHVKDNNDQQVIIEVDMPAAAEPWETLDLYTWTGKSWEWVGSELHTESAENEFIRAWVVDIPDNVVVVQTGAIPQSISAPLGAEDSLAAAAGVVDEINPTGLMMGPVGVEGKSIIGAVAQIPDVNAYTVMPILREPSAHGPLVDVLTKPNTQKMHIDDIVTLCTGQGFAGVEIDYRGITPEEREVYSAFIGALADALHAQGLRLTVAVEPPTFVGAEWNTGGYDWAALGAAADAVKVPFPDDPAAYVEGGEAQRLLNWATARVSRYKLRMQVSSLSVEQRGSETKYISLEDALAPFGQVATVGGVTQVAPNSEVKFTFTGIEAVRGIVPQDATGTYRIEYAADDSTAYTVWLGTAASLAVKLQWAQRYHLGGIAVNDVLNPGNAPGIAEAVMAYRAATTPPTGQQVEVVWTVASAAAELDRKAAPLTDPSYTWMVVAATDTYTVKATIAGVERGSVMIAVGEAAATPTPVAVADVSPPPASGCLKASFVGETVPDGTKFDKGETFVKSWSMRNSGTCDWPADTALVKVSSQTGGPDSVPVGAVAVGETKEIQVELTAPNEDGSYTSKWSLRAGGAQLAEVWAVITVGNVPSAPLAPAGPISAGAFELGGQTHTLANPDKMHYAGMTWVKIQHKWGPGDAPGSVKWKIDAARANGFKVLLSIPGSDEYPTSIDFAGYVEFLRGVAALSPDAIEVWNEQNIDREWPKGQVSPEVYVQQMLAPAYNAIKSTNPNVMVISGAPSPTGWFGGCSGAGCDDGPYVASMAAAGAANYADCIGIHYNEGIVPPSQTSGDPRNPSDHYTRYFWSMVNTYYNAFGGSRQLCFTELGYLTDDGYAPVNPAGGFPWAANTTVAQQAQWLAEATSLAASSGKVRLLIVWNVDIFSYNPTTDPQGGYAIIRPDGSCPACETLHNVLGSR